MSVGRLRVNIDIRAVLLVGAVYTALTVIITYPVAFQLGTVLAGKPGHDSLEYVWVLWWLRSAVFERHIDPNYIPILNYPYGLYQPLRGVFIPWVEISSLPLLAVISPQIVYNLQFLASFVLSGLTMYWLCLELSADRWAAFIGGLVFAFFPHRMGHAISGHLNLIADYWLPLYALGLIRLMREPSWRRAVWGGIALGLCLLSNVLLVTYFVPLFTVIYLGWEWWNRRGEFGAKRWAMLTVVALIGGVIALPFYLPLLIAYLGNGVKFIGEGGAVNYSADLLGFITPSFHHPVLERLGLVPEWFNTVVPDIKENLVYLGVMPLALGIWGAHRRREAVPWVVLALIAAVLSLGPFLKVGGKLVNYTVEDTSSLVMMPYFLLTMMPFFSLSRTPARLNEIAVLALAVLAAYGVARLQDKGHWRPVVKAGIMVALAGTIIFEYFSVWPLPTGSTIVSSYYRHIAEDSSDRAVLDLPVLDYVTEKRAMYAQVTHRHPIVGGRVYRVLASSEWMPEFLGALIQSRQAEDVVPVLEMDERRTMLSEVGVGWVVVHRERVATDDETYTLLTDMLGQPVFEDEDIVVYTVPEGQQVEQELVHALAKDTWYNVERWDGKAGRWIGQEGRLYLYSSTRQQGRLRFTVLPYRDVRLLEVKVNGRPVALFAVGDWQEYTTPPFELEEGLNQVRFHVVNGCSEFAGDPACLGGTAVGGPFRRPVECDQTLATIHRCLSVLVQDVCFVRGEDGAVVSHPLSVPLGEKVRFLGFDLARMEISDRKRLEVWLYWQGLSPMHEDYTIFVHLTDAAGQVMAQHDGYPLDGSYPTSAWPVGVILADRVEIPIPPDLPPGEYTLKTGMYLLSTLERLPVAGDVSGENAIVLGTVTVK